MAPKRRKAQISSLPAKLIPSRKRTKKVPDTSTAPAVAASAAQLAVESEEARQVDAKDVKADVPPTAAAAASKESYAVEQPGQVLSTTSWTFDRTQVIAAFDAPRVNLTGEDGVVFLGMAPSGGSMSGDRVDIVAWAFDEKKKDLVLIGCESTEIKGTDDRNTIYGFVTALRADPRYKRARIVTMVESNFSQNLADHYLQWIREAAAGGVAWTGGKLTTTKATIENGVNTMRKLFEGQTLRIDAKLVGETSEKDAKVMKEQFCNMLTEEKANKTNSSLIRCAVSGKKSGQTDIARLMMISVAHGFSLMETKDYKDEMKGRGHYTIAAEI